MIKACKFVIFVCITLLSLFSCAEEAVVLLTEGPGDTALLESSDDIGVSFEYFENGHKVSLDYEAASIQWHYICFDFLGFKDLFYDRFTAGDKLPQTVPDGTEISVSFGAYTPADIIITRDTATYDRVQSDTVSVDEVPYLVNAASVTSGQSVAFIIDFGDSDVLYYNVSAEWSNGNWIMYAFAVRRA
jgi:hypothetical protein